MVRGREFLMKDAYSFTADWEGLDRVYRAMQGAYERIFTRCGLDFRTVEADAGAIGGEGGTHEFMALADIGEDTVVACEGCGYAANLELAETGFAPVSPKAAQDVPVEKFATPGTRTIEELTDTYGFSARELIKTLIYLADGSPVAVLVRGDRTVNETKLKRYLRAEHVELADEGTIRSAAGAPPGFVGPAGLTIPVLVDREVAGLPSAIAGAGEAGYHVRGIRPGRDFPIDRVGDFREAAPGDRCPRCEGPLHFLRGIEVGHIFKLGTRYSGKLGALFTDPAGGRRTCHHGSLRHRRFASYGRHRGAAPHRFGPHLAACRRAVSSACDPGIGSGRASDAAGGRPLPATAGPGRRCAAGRPRGTAGR
ncbi:hypothetical protein LJK88_12990 [Paenibacillus sp. P26]|nr:hypothetical protein LJK88_12990 [Paenibacillus sp. P26]